MAAVPRTLRRLLRNRLLTAGLLALGLLLALAWIVPAMRPDPNLADVERGLSAMGAPLPPSWSAPLGTDDLGRDQLSRVSHAARSSLFTAATATALALAIGLLIGLAAGLGGGWIELALSRIIELTFSFPVLLLAILAATALRAAEIEDDPLSMALVLGLFGWPTTARVMRARAAVLGRAEFVVAARALGAGTWRVVTRHVLPNLSGALAVMMTFTVAQLLIAEAMLSFAGLGAPPPTATWGRMVFEGRVYYRSAPWLLLAPGLALVLAVFSFHLIGAGLQRELEQRPAP